MQQTVRLLDRLGEEYGEEHVYHNLRSPADAIKMLCINRPKFYEELLVAHKSGIFYRVMQSGADMKYNELHLTLGSKDLYIVPVIVGSDGTAGRLLLGVGLIAASFLIPGAGLFGTSFFAGVGGATALSVVGTAAGAIGTAMVLGSVADMISPQPQLPSLSGSGRMQGTGESVRGTGPGGVTRATSGEKSYAYTGATSSAGVGATVPVAFGKVLAGSHLLSLDISTSVEKVVTTSLSAPGLNTLRVNQEYVNSKFESLGGLRTRTWKGNSDGSNSNIDYTSNTTEDKDQITHRNDSNAELRLLYDADGKRILPKTSSLQKNALQDDDRRQNFQVFFEMDQGLYDKVGFAGSARVDGSVSYTITLKAAGMKGSDQNVATVAASVQGNIDRSDPIRWCHAIAFPKLDKSSDTFENALIETIVEVTDFNIYKRANEGDSGQMRLKVMFTGYEFFRENAENDTSRLIAA